MAKKAYVGVLTSSTVETSITSGVLYTLGASTVAFSYESEIRPIWNETDGKFEFSSDVTTEQYSSFVEAMGVYGDIMGDGGWLCGIEDANPTAYYVYLVVGGGAESYFEYTHMTDSVARKVKKGYLGVDGVARKIRKAYIGIGGVARPCWSGGELTYYGAITSLSVARGQLEAANAGNYAVFACGLAYTSKAVRQSTIDAYDKDTLVRTTSSLYTATDFASTSVGEYAVFGGGETSTTDVTEMVRAKNASLTTISVSSLTKPRYNFEATTVGDYALFIAGHGFGTYTCTEVDVYNSQLTKVSFSWGLSSDGTSDFAAVTLDNYAIFGGGYYIYDSDDSGCVSTMYCLDNSLTSHTITGLSRSTQSLVGSCTKSYALFGGGINNSGTKLTFVNAYDKSLTRTIISDLSNSKTDGVGTSFNGIALFAGGMTDNTIDVYDDSLTKTTTLSLSETKRNLASTVIGNYAFFGGGTTSSNNTGHSSKVEVFTVA